ncbi:HEXXH motif-containing putative peptide modification protein [Streptomyces sp. SID13031]|uniref:aKG-HExxH-type peptide beta-hydroxylase n=1 Tax=Streptomyces sp. SID13031 TaxID=2706046 RepID=UPI0013CA4608|nr:HEXXH motif-containing putative peptide modification protein [Streptomyces sp. SID13031]NEA34327.1 hypothetical protein [Streptomyces sp. SID13031]
MLRDPVLRNLFEADLQSRNGTGRPLLAELKGTQLGGQPAWPRLGSARVWAEMPGRDAGSYAGLLWGLFDSAFPGPGLSLPVEPSVDQLAALSGAADLLTALLPDIGRGVLRHVGLIGLTRNDSPEGPLHSVSGGDTFPATVFLAPEKLTNPWDAAGAILHEGLHLALFEIIRCGAMYRFQVPVQEPVVLIPWRVQPWSLMRVLFALHVYVHMVLFNQVAQTAALDLRERFGEPLPGTARSMASVSVAGFATPTERATYLAGELKSRFGLLTRYGQDFVHWLEGALEDLISPAETKMPTASYRAVPPTSVVQLLDQQRVVVAMPNPSRLCWLNLNSWLIYSLCDGRERTAIRDEYLAAVHHLLPRAEAETQLDGGLRELVRQGLVVSTYGHS